ncbi:Na+/H+ antiporter [Rhizobium leguminosarum]|uniref:Na+/H+ antiporter n=1 Tax=Rhizobium leguminosarum TaxID=384 RepID=UPI003F951107
MEGTLLFELVVGMVLAIIALQYAARKLGLPPSVALLTGGAIIAFIPGLPAITIDPELVLVIFLPPLLLDGAWTFAIGRLRRHLIGIVSLAVGAVLFTCATVAFVTHMLFPTLPWPVCAALGAIISPPDAVSVKAVLDRVTIPRRLQILLEGESLLNDASGLVLFRFAVGAIVTGAFDLGEAVSTFFVLALGGVAVGFCIGMLWVKCVRFLDDDYLIIAATSLLAWVSYLTGELFHVSGVIATVTTGLIATWHQHTVMSAAARMRGTSFWKVVIFLMEASVFILIGLSLRAVVERGGGFEMVWATMAIPVGVVLVTLIAARFAWVFASDFVILGCGKLRLTNVKPLGIGGSAVVGWAGVRGVVTLALALSLPEIFPARDFILVTAFAVIIGTVLIQGTTLGKIIEWAGLTEPVTERSRLALGEAEAALAKVKFTEVERLAYDRDGTLIHPQLLERYERMAATTVDYSMRTEHYKPVLDAHFGVVIEALGAARKELVRLHRAGDVDDEILRELEHDLDLEELSAIAARA